MSATTYAAVISLSHVLNRVKHNESQIQSLFDKVNFFIDFLEKNSQSHTTIDGMKGLEVSIVEAAHKAEDAMESYVVDQIPMGIIHMDSTSKKYIHLCESLQGVIEEMDVIKAEVMKLEKVQVDSCARPLRSLAHLPADDDIVVGLEEEMIGLMDQLTSHKPENLVIPIVGMGGIGKTTLARKIYNHSFVVNHFDVRAWVTVSQDYRAEEIFICLLHDIGAFTQNMNRMDSQQLGVQLHKGLFGAKYLIVLDDIWTMVPWDLLMRFFPDNNNGSRILITTRSSSLALGITSHSPYEVKFLDDRKSWDLLSKMVFGDGDCSLELEDLGKKIAKSCKGLPLAIVVIGGLFRASKNTRGFWEEVVKNINSVVNAENGEICLKILALSYNHLPIHLKPCFLYMATFPEDFRIKVSRLIKLWVADGFLKPNTNKTLEDVALECLNDLVGRNLIMVGERSSRGKMKTCMVHDLLRDLCLKEAQRESFVHVTKEFELVFSQTMKNQHRLVVNQDTYKHVTVKRLHSPNAYSVLSALQHVRSWISNFRYGVSPELPPGCMLRVFGGFHRYALNDVLGLSNARYLEALISTRSCSILSGTSLPWNLESIIVDDQMGYGTDICILPSEIWKLTYLRHLVISPKVILPNHVVAQTSQHKSSILYNLQTLCTIYNFTCSNEVLGITPNLRKLGLYYDRSTFLHDLSLTRCFDNLVHLHKLEILKCSFLRNWRHSHCAFHEPETLTLSPNLQKLTLSGSRFSWKNMSTIGSLPNLEVLKLSDDAFHGQEWKSVEGEFRSLKHLSIDECDLVTWTAESSHFPRLQYLGLRLMRHLEDIPCGIGDITSLVSVRLLWCSTSAIMSAKEIQEEQQSMGHDDFLIQVILPTIYEDYKQEMLNLANDKFQVTFTSRIHDRRLFKRTTMI